MKGKRFGFFPSVSMGWRITNEEFMKGTQDWLNNLKLRASYGQVGNEMCIRDRYKGRRGKPVYINIAAIKRTGSRIKGY